MASLAEAIALFRRGHAAGAAELCDRLVERGIEVPGALGLLSEVHAAAGRLDEAIQSLKRLVDHGPAEAAAWRRLGSLQLSAGRLADAEASFRQSLVLDPGSARACNNLGQAQMRLGHIAAARQSFDRAIAADSAYAIAHCNLAVALRRLGDYHAALHSGRHALTLDPALVEAHCACAEALVELNRIGDACASYDASLALRPDYVVALLGRAHALHRLRRFEASLRDYQHVLRLTPDHVDALCNGASTLLELKRQEQALEWCTAALRISPDLPEAHNNLGGALRDLHRQEEAWAAFDRALALRPGMLVALCNRGKLLSDMGETAAARESFALALQEDPNHPEARAGYLMAVIPAVARSRTEADAAREVFASELVGFGNWLQEQVELEPTDVVGVSWPFFLAYAERNNRDLLQSYGALSAWSMNRWQGRNPSLRQGEGSRPAGRIRVGVVSAQVRDHSVYRALSQGWIEQLSRETFEIGIIHLGTTQDAYTDAARRSSEFYVGGDRMFSEWVTAIRSQQLDVLVYPEVGMDPTTLRLASLRLAPVQLAGWGHPESTGLPTIDGYLSAELFEPPEAADYYCERLLPLPNLGCYCQPYEQQPSAIDQAALGVASDRPVLLCPGMPFKYAPEHDIVFVEIARRLGRCQMVFFEPEDRSLSRKLHERLRRAFLEQQLSPDEYLLFIPWLPRGQFFALLRLADVCLDTIGFSGFNTALQAVECGLPMACYEGRFMRGRLASAVMTRMAMRDLVALNPGEFVDLAVRLASDRSFNQQMRVQLLAASPVLFRDRAAIDGLEQALVHLVRNRSAPASPVVTEP